MVEWPLSNKYISVLKHPHINKFNMPTVTTLPGLLSLAIFITSGLCAIYQKVGDVKQDQFDFVIAGG
jgi:hypothetical protein